jgi:vacuolar-type H+-ATPase subunit H
MADVNKTIQITYEAQTKDLEKALRRIPGITEQEVQKMSKEMQKHFKDTERAAAKSSKKIGASFKQAGKAVGALGAGVALAAAGVIAFGQHLADLSNELVDASTKTGLTVENLGGLRLAAEGAGVAFAQLEPGLIKLQAAIKNAAEGNLRNGTMSSTT